jgi:hypothetical protein
VRKEGSPIAGVSKIQAANALATILQYGTPFWDIGYRFGNAPQPEVDVDEPHFSELLLLRMENLTFLEESLNLILCGK